ncbi:MAG: hypothetical protein P4L75_01650, partial [Clostridia bacterium]|nr:hypothetical protein [Clostridia bacterium]
MDRMEQNETAAWFFSVSEPYAAGYFEYPERSRFYRFSRAQRKFWEFMTLPAYDGGKLYPCGLKFNDPCAVLPDYSYTMAVNWPLLEKKGGPGVERMRGVMNELPPMDTPHTVGGSGYTHSIPNYGRIIREGLNAYKSRVQVLPRSDFSAGLLDLLEGIGIYHARALHLLKASHAPAALIEALGRMPFLP